MNFNETSENKEGAGVEVPLCNGHPPLKLLCIQVGLELPVSFWFHKRFAFTAVFQGVGMSTAAKLQFTKTSRVCGIFAKTQTILVCLPHSPCSLQHVALTGPPLCILLPSSGPRPVSSTEIVHKATAIPSHGSSAPTLASLQSALHTNARVTAHQFPALPCSYSSVALLDTSELIS